MLICIRSRAAKRKHVNTASCAASATCRRRLFKLPGHISIAADLLQDKSSRKGAASALKKSAATENKVGPVLDVQGVHADDSEVPLQIQVSL
jgi:hypothetical protein